MRDQDPAFDLVAACVAWPPTPARDARVRAAAERVRDWTPVIALTARHRVVALVAAALDRTGVELAIGPREALARRAQASARRDAQMSLETARLQALLDAAGIPNLVLKGATLSALAYGRAGLKQSLDIDLLIGPEHLAAATRVLDQAGYGRESPLADLSAGQLEATIELTREAAFRRRSDQLLVELQWRADINPLWLVGLGARAAHQVAHLAGSPPLRAPAPDWLYAYLCAHGARHGFTRLKWLADIGALLARQDPDAIEALHARAAALGVARASGLTLRLCHRLLGLEPPPALAPGLASDRVLGWLEALCLDFMTGGGTAEAQARPFYALRLLLLQLLLNDRRDRLVAELKLRWASPRDRLTLALPQWADFLYPLLRLPLFMARRLGELGPRRGPS